MKILITAGPTWIKVDAVRILTSIFTGRSGIYLAKELHKRGFTVTLLINPHCLTINREANVRGIKIILFRYFEEFKTRVIKELKKSHYDAIIHSAAVSDYKLKTAFAGKIPSGKSVLTLHLSPAEKIITLMRVIASDALLVQFKLETKRAGLIEKACRSLKSNKSDFVVANALEDLKTGYKAFLLDRSKRCITLNSKKALCDHLYRIISKNTLPNEKTLILSSKKRIFKIK